MSLKSKDMSQYMTLLPQRVGLCVWTSLFLSLSLFACMYVYVVLTHMLPSLSVSHALCFYLFRSVSPSVSFFFSLCLFQTLCPCNDQPLWEPVNQLHMEREELISNMRMPEDHWTFSIYGLLCGTHYRCVYPLRHLHLHQTMTLSLISPLPLSDFMGLYKLPSEYKVTCLDGLQL